MKKNLLVLFFAITAVVANAQVACTPDAQYTTFGIYPDSIINLPPACLDEVYEVTVTAVVPHDTDVTMPAPIGTFTAIIDSINIKNVGGVFQVSGLPPNFTFACEPPSCSFAGGPSPGTVNKGCLLIYGNPTSPDVSAGDTFNLQVDLVAYISGVPLLNTYTLDDGSEDVNYYFIAIKANGTCVPCATITNSVIFTNASAFGVCDGDVSVTASGGATPYAYAWTTNANGQTTAAVTGLCAGTYSVTVTGNDGCIATSSVVISQPVGISGTTNSLFIVKQNTPNPFLRNTNIQFTSNTNGKVTFTVYNIIGEVVHTEQLLSKENFQNVILFDGRNLPVGIYSYSLNNGEKTISKRMVMMEK